MRTWNIDEERDSTFEKLPKQRDECWNFFWRMTSLWSNFFSMKIGHRLNKRKYVCIMEEGGDTIDEAIVVEEFTFIHFELSTFHLM